MKHTDHAIRERLRAWVRHLWIKYQHHYETQGDFARHLGITQASLSQVLSGRRTVGLDLLLRIHRRIHISVDVMLDTDPPDITPL